MAMASIGLRRRLAALGITLWSKGSVANVAVLTLAAWLIAIARPISVRAQVWSIKASVPAAKTEPAIDTVNGIIYLAGGSNGGDSTNLQAYDPTLNAWKAMAPLPAGRYQSEAGVINSQLYVAGGWNTASALPTTSCLYTIRRPINGPPGPAFPTSAPEEAAASSTTSST